MSFEEFPLNEDFQGYAATSKVETELETTQKRRRRNKPCVYCRKRKTKCVREGLDTKCLECIKRELECINEESNTVSDLCCDNCQYKRKQCLPLGPGSCYDCLLDGLTCISTGVKSIRIEEIHGENHRDLGINSNKEINLINHSLQSSNFITKNNALYESLIDISAQTSKSFTIEIQSIVAAVGPQLIQLFFKYFNSSIPLLSAQQGEMFINLKPQSTVNPLLLVMIYLNALKFSPLDPLIVAPLINKTKLENLAVILSKELKTSSLEMIQGLILMIYYNFTENVTYNSKSLMFLHKCIELVEYNGFNYTSDNSIEHKLVLWQIIKLDKFVPLLEFKPMRTRDWNVEKLTNSELPKEEISGVQLNILELSNSYCGELIDSLFNYKSLKNDSLEQVIDKSQNFIQSITQWYTSLSSEIESTITINLHYYLLIFITYRRLINKIIQEQKPIQSISSMTNPIIKTLSSFNDILLMNQLKQMLQYQLLPNYLANCFTNYYIVLQLLNKLKLNVTGLIQSYELKSKQLAAIHELKHISDFELMNANNSTCLY